MAETKRDRFVRVAEARTNKIIKMMSLLGNCANKNNYEYTTKDVKTIITTLEKELTILKNKFEQEVEEEKPFRLGD